MDEAKKEELYARCRRCDTGICCREGVELTESEMKRVLRLRPAPDIRRPWFKPIDRRENPDSDCDYETLLRDNRCVFQAKNNRCLVYRVRPRYCREFPLEGNGLAPYYTELCDRVL
ncbi:MAG: YkgJ family cysteine cluster protein [Candidatus Omnitrophota bacterium]